MNISSNESSAVATATTSLISSQALMDENLTVLVIDDSKTIVKTAEILLSEQGCQVLTASDGFESLAIIAENRPDLIFVDVMMPRLDGYQTCALIKANPDYQAIPVVMLSSKDGIFDMARGRLAGSESYITKPFTRNDLLTAIAKHIFHAEINNTGTGQTVAEPIAQNTVNNEANSSSNQSAVSDATSPAHSAEIMNHNPPHEHQHAAKMAMMEDALQEVEDMKLNDHWQPTTDAKHTALADELAKEFADLEFLDEKNLN